MLRVASLKAVILVVLVASIDDTAGQGCPATDPASHVVHLPHESDCSKFYACVHGSPVLQSCPGGLHFNAVLQVCDWPEQASCSASSVSKCQDNTLLPHEKDCTEFYSCVHGTPILQSCPGGLHFNSVQQICDWPDQAGCAKKSKCQPLINDAGFKWMPSTCSSRSGEVNETCIIECAAGFEHSGGKSVTCQPDGWFGQRGAVGEDISLPTCFLITDLGDLIVDKINETLGGRDGSFLFLLDESGSVRPSEFLLEIRFMNSLVSGFPLSAKRASGAITFASYADVDIHMNETNTCSFLDKAKLIKYSSGGTNILGALLTAIQEIKSHSLHNLNLVFLVTDGQSSDPSSAADQLKANGDVLFTVGVAGYSAQQLIPISSLDKAGNPLFYGIDSFSIFEKVAEYLETKFNPSSVGCGAP